MSAHPARGWLPLDFELDPEPAVITSANVRWMDFGQSPLSEPFFRQTVARLQSAAPPAAQLDTSLAAMLALSDRLSSVTPAGFIFHVSHCGSTLVANTLRQSQGAFVASEPGAFIRLARWYPEGPSPYLRQRWDNTRRRLFDSLFRLFAHHRTKQPERLVVKFASMNLFGMKFVRACWPEVPCLLLVREPCEVLVSTLYPRGWTSRKTTENAKSLYGWSEPPYPVEDMPDEEYCGRLLGRHMEAALESLDPGCRVLDYSELDRERMSSIAHFFGLAFPSSQSLDSVFQTYSKDPQAEQPFTDDRTLKRQATSRAVRAAAEAWVEPVYKKLLARRTG